MGNLKEMDRFLEKVNLPRLNQEEIKLMNKPIISTEISPRPDGLHRRILSNI